MKQHRACYTKKLACFVNPFWSEGIRKLCHVRFGQRPHSLPVFVNCTSIRHFRASITPGRYPRYPSRCKIVVRCVAALSLHKERLSLFWSSAPWTFWSVKAKVFCYRMRALTSRIVRTTSPREDPQPCWTHGEVYTFAAAAYRGIR